MSFLHGSAGLGIWKPRIDREEFLGWVFQTNNSFLSSVRRPGRPGATLGLLRLRAGSSEAIGDHGPGEGEGFVRADGLPARFGRHKSNVLLSDNPLDGMCARLHFWTFAVRLL